MQQICGSQFFPPFLTGVGEREGESKRHFRSLVTGCAEHVIFVCVRSEPLARTLRAKQLAGVNRDRRRAKRYPLRVAVTFCWKRKGGILQTARGITLDISYRGLFILSDLSPLVGAHLKLEVYLPSVRGAAKSVRLHGEGKVIRTKRKGPVLGFGAEVVLQNETSRNAPLCNMGLIN